MVRTATGATLLSTDGGSTFATAPATAAFPPLNVVITGKERWEIDPAGRVLHVADTRGEHALRCSTRARPISARARI